MSRTSIRLKRVAPGRKGPIRNPVSQWDSADRYTGFESARKKKGKASKSPEGGVRNAYDVIEDYMRRGYEAAFDNQNSIRRGPMKQDKANLNIQTILTPLTQLSDLWLDGMRKWIDVLSAFVPRESETASASAPVHPPQVTVQVFSDRPTDVSVQLTPGTDEKDLKADSLDDGPNVPPIKAGNISIKRDNKGNVRILLKVDKDQPAGKYVGAIRVESDHRPVGKIIATIDPVDFSRRSGR
jgi:hypothetical protein